MHCFDILKKPDRVTIEACTASLCASDCAHMTPNQDICSYRPTTHNSHLTIHPIASSSSKLSLRNWCQDVVLTTENCYG